MKQSYEMAEKTVQTSSTARHASAMVSLGFMYEHGEGSNERAKEYYDQAALLGYAKAQYNLGCLYAIGNGVPKNE